MVDFSNLRKTSVAGKTARCEVLNVIGLDPDKPVVIIGRPATQDNKPFFSAFLKKMGTSRRAMRRGKVSPELLDMQRQALKELFPRYVFVGWENVPDNNGDEVPFSTGAAAEFCEQIDEYVFDDIRDFFEDADSFISGDTPRIDAEEVSGN